MIRHVRPLSHRHHTRFIFLTSTSLVSWIAALQAFHHLSSHSGHQVGVIFFLLHKDILVRYESRRKLGGLAGKLFSASSASRIKDSPMSDLKFLQGSARSVVVLFGRRLLGFTSLLSFGVFTNIPSHHIPCYGVSAFCLF
jgi:hypothetical protein